MDIGYGFGTESKDFLSIVDENKQICSIENITVCRISCFHKLLPLNETTKIHLEISNASLYSPILMKCNESHNCEIKAIGTYSNLLEVFKISQSKNKISIKIELIKNEGIDKVCSHLYLEYLSKRIEITDSLKDNRSFSEEATLGIGYYPNLFKIWCEVGGEIHLIGEKGVVVSMEELMELRCEPKSIKSSFEGGGRVSIKGVMLGSSVEKGNIMFRVGQIYIQDIYVEDNDTVTLFLPPMLTYYSYTTLRVTHIQPLHGKVINTEGTGTGRFAFDANLSTFYASNLPNCYVAIVPSSPAFLSNVDVYIEDIPELYFMANSLCLYPTLSRKFPLTCIHFPDVHEGWNRFVISGDWNVTEVVIEGSNYCHFNSIEVLGVLYSPSRASSLKTHLEVVMDGNSRNVTSVEYSSSYTPIIASVSPGRIWGRAGEEVLLEGENLHPNTALTPLAYKITLGGRLMCQVKTLSQERITCITETADNKEESIQLFIENVGRGIMRGGGVPIQIAYNWSNGDSWGYQSDNIIIPLYSTVIMDIEPTALIPHIRVHGTLLIPPTLTHISFTSIIVHPRGKLIIGANAGRIGDVFSQEIKVGSIDIESGGYLDIEGGTGGHCIMGVEGEEGSMRIPLHQAGGFTEGDSLLMWGGGHSLVTNILGILQEVEGEDILILSHPINMTMRNICPLSRPILIIPLSASSPSLLHIQGDAIFHINNIQFTALSSHNLQYFLYVQDGNCRDCYLNNSSVLMEGGSAIFLNNTRNMSVSHNLFFGGDIPVLLGHYSPSSISNSNNIYTNIFLGEGHMGNINNMDNMNKTGIWSSTPYNNIKGNIVSGLVGEGITLNFTSTPGLGCVDWEELLGGDNYLEYIGGSGVRMIGGGECMGGLRGVNAEHTGIGVTLSGVRGWVWDAVITHCDSSLNVYDQALTPQPDHACLSITGGGGGGVNTLCKSPSLSLIIIQTTTPFNSPHSSTTKTNSTFTSFLISSSLSLVTPLTLPLLPPASLNITLHLSIQDQREGGYMLNLSVREPHSYMVYIPGEEYKEYKRGKVLWAPSTSTQGECGSAYWGSEENILINVKSRCSVSLIQKDALNIEAYVRRGWGNFLEDRGITTLQNDIASLLNNNQVYISKVIPSSEHIKYIVCSVPHNSSLELQGQKLLDYLRESTQPFSDVLSSMRITILHLPHNITTHEWERSQELEINLVLFICLTGVCFVGAGMAIWLITLCNKGKLPTQTPNHEEQREQELGQFSMLNIHNVTEDEHSNSAGSRESEDGGDINITLDDQELELAARIEQVGMTHSQVRNLVLDSVRDVMAPLHDDDDDNAKTHT